MFDINEPASLLEVRDVNNNIIAPIEPYNYELKNGLYSYFVYKEGFDVKEDTFIISDKSINIEVTLNPLGAEHAYMKATGREGEHEIDGITYTFVEFEMLNDSDERVSLAEDNVEYIRANGRNLGPNTDETLWFNKNRDTGRYEYVVKTKDGIVYQAIHDWVKL